MVLLSGKKLRAPRISVKSSDRIKPNITPKERDSMIGMVSKKNVVAGLGSFNAINFR
jgi:hypothetical protein